MDSKKGSSVELNINNIAIYERPIRVYEGNDLKVVNGKIYINGKLATKYTFKLDYYWMMGDNRHNSADSRYWGFCARRSRLLESQYLFGSHLTPDRNGFKGIRWSRMFNMVDNIK